MRLRDALAEAGWTGQQLAAAVNAAGREVGVALSYDRTAVAHWLAGTQPRLPAPDLLAEVFSRRLKRPVSAADLGLTHASAWPPAVAAAGSGSPPPLAGTLSRGRTEDDDVVSVLVALADPHSITDPVYSLAALAVPDWPAGGGRRTLSRRPLPARAEVTPTDVVTAERLARLFGATDKALGGSYVRSAAALYLGTNLAPKLRMPAPPARRRRLLTAATEMAYLCAFTCFDDELHGLGQQYYLTALQLAAENADQDAYAITLRGMSVQAGSLGHHQEARQLAETAVGSVRRATPVRQAFLLGQLAVARASDGDRTGALASLAEAERSLDQATSATPLIGAYHPASLAHQQAVVQSLLGDKHGAIAALSASVRQRPGGERRARAVTLAYLAELQLSVGQLDEAVQTWHSFLNDYPYLQSRRVTTALHTLRRDIRPHTRNPAVRMLMRRANAQFARVRRGPTDPPPAS